MKLQIATTEGQNTFTAYGEGYVSVNAVRHSSNLIVLPERLIPEWTSASFATLSLADFEFLSTLENDIILLGTGNEHRFPRPELMQPLMRANKGLEVMTIQAACRTYNILISEGRKVSAALLFT
jgi:uncharacterized protein